MASGKAAGRSRSGPETVIAPVAVADGCVVVPGDERLFSGLEVLNPVRGGA